MARKNTPGQKNYSTPLLLILSILTIISIFLHVQSRTQLEIARKENQDLRERSRIKQAELTDLERQVTLSQIPCGNEWETYLERLGQGDGAVVPLFENCILERGYPFKKLPIPDTPNDYFGFMGNGSSTDTLVDGPWCQFDGEPQGCLLYKVENHRPVILSNGINRRSHLTLAQPIAVQDADNLILRHFPYEICYFTAYNIFDFTNGTTTAEIVLFYPADPCSETSSLTFALDAVRTIDITLQESTSSDAVPSLDLFYSGERIGSVPATLSNWDESSTSFPHENDLADYAKQKDKTKFYFSVGDSNYTLNLAPGIPILIQR